MIPSLNLAVKTKKYKGNRHRKIKTPSPTPALATAGDKSCVIIINTVFIFLHLFGLIFVNLTILFCPQHRSNRKYLNCCLGLWAGYGSLIV